MLVLAATDTLSGGASAASQVTCTIFGMELVGTTETYKCLYQGQLAASPATLYTVPSSTTAFVKSMHVVNNDTSARTFQLFFNIGGAGVAAADAFTPLWTLGPGESAHYIDGNGWTFYTNLGQRKDSDTSNNWRVVALGADATANSTTTIAFVPGLDQTCEIGTFVFEYFIRYQAAAATTGVKFSVDHTGTVASIIWNMRYVDVSATAATAVPDQDNNLATAAVMAAFAARADNVTLGPTLSVDTLNADMLMLIEGLVVVTAGGTLRLGHASEVAAASTVKLGSTARLLKAA